MSNRIGYRAKHSWAILVLFSLFSFIATGPGTAEIKLTFGTYTADKPTATVRKLKPVLRYLEKALSQKLGEPVRISTQIARNYDKGISNLVDGKVDFARFGPASYVFAKQKADGISILAMEAVKGQRVFSGIICVQANSKIASLAELGGKTFAFGSKLSTIGRFLSQGELLDAGIKGGDLKKYAFLGRHDRVGTAVGSGEFEAGALKYSTFKKLKKKNIAIRELHRFDNVTKPWIARAGLQSRIASALKDALLGIEDPSVLKAIKKSGFLAGDDSDYDIIRLAVKKSRQFDS